MSICTRSISNSLERVFEVKQRAKPLIPEGNLGGMYNNNNKSLVTKENRGLLHTNTIKRLSLMRENEKCASEFSAKNRI